MIESKRKLKTLIEFGRMIPAEKRHRIRIACRKFRTPAHLALGLLLDAISAADLQNIDQLNKF